MIPVAPPRSMRAARPNSVTLPDVLDSPGLTSSYQPWSPGASQLPASLYSPSPVKTLVFHPKQADSGKHAHGIRVAAKQEPLAAHGSWSAAQEAETPPRNMPAAGYYGSLHTASAGDPLHELQRLNTQMYLAEREQQSSQLLWPPGPAYQPDFAHQEQPAPTPWWRQPAGATSQVIGLSGRHAMQAPSAGTTRPPLSKDATSMLNQPALPEETLAKVAAMCHVAHSKGCTPENLDQSLVEDLLALQLRADKPLRAPWYRDGPRPEPFGRRGPPAQRRAAGQRSSGMRSAPGAKPPAGRAADKENQPAASGTGFFCPKR